MEAAVHLGVPLVRVAPHLGRPSEEWLIIDLHEDLLEKSGEGSVLPRGNSPFGLVEVMELPFAMIKSGVIS